MIEYICVVEALFYTETLYVKKIVKFSELTQKYNIYLTILRKFR